MLVHDLVNDLKSATAPRLGRFGEKIYAQFMTERGHSVQSLHKDGADFVVSDLGRVDVKTKGFGKVRWGGLRRSDTVYCYVDLSDDGVELTHQSSTGEPIGKIAKLTWAEVCCLWGKDDYRLTSATSEAKVAILQRTRALKDWIRMQWGQKAAVIYRNGRRTQESMEGGVNPWGPVTFYEPLTAKRKIDIKVLMYFEGGDVYKVLAYPIDRRHEINWVVGRAKEDSVSFDPGLIDEKFKFVSEDDFKINFKIRFELG